ncbi:hypothetical protein H6F43_07140 [Leptolyngbya sp. FACHB-36]|nr:hypothetical protein [Leptolyngbya sp. FACHB-36]
MFLKGNVGIDRPPNIDPGSGGPGSGPGGGTPGGTGTPDDPFNGGGGSTTTPPIGPGSGTIVFEQFGGVGRGVTPSPETIAEVDTLKFSGAGLTARNLLLTQVGSDLQVSFEDFASPIVVLKTFALENLDTITQPIASENLANILFDGQVSPQDSFDVANADWQGSQIFTASSVTFLNDLDNDVQGFDESNDVINGQGGSDRILGLSGNDLLRGGLGNDTLIGGAGTNVLTGNAGADVFALSLDGVQFVTDFAIAQDKIGLSNGLSVAQLTIEQGTGVDSSSTWVKLASNDSLLMSLKGVTASALTTDMFLPAAAYQSALSA